MSIDPVAHSAAATAAEREILVLKKLQNNSKQVGQALVELVKSAPAPAPAPGRIDTYA